MTIRTVGIIGAGKLGTAIGRLAATAGLSTLITSRPSPMLPVIVGSVLPEAELVDWDRLAELEERADAVVLAVPATGVADLDLSHARGTVIDATNPWEATGTADAGAGVPDTTPALDPAHDLDLHVARALNHVSYEELLGSARTPEQGGARRALAVVSDDPVALATASELVDRLGFDAVAVPEEKAGPFRPDGRLFGAWLDAGQLAAAVA
ncbi:NADPH-dependent F420 reductase [Actinomyces radicidentis]|uniref:NADPH-dependent F420 reductase n=1 Tax=Actinomyces radicidentis TaxID=111015 RepID=UPI0012378C62|nr:NAD(P)-binding domain-containing protein [Actinomyces radicidentis]